MAFWSSTASPTAYMAAGQKRPNWRRFGVGKVTLLSLVPFRSWFACSLGYSRSFDLQPHDVPDILWGCRSVDRPRILVFEALPMPQTTTGSVSMHVTLLPFAVWPRDTVQKGRASAAWRLVAQLSEKAQSKRALEAWIVWTPLRLDCKKSNKTKVTSVQATISQRSCRLHRLPLASVAVEAFWMLSLPNQTKRFTKKKHPHGYKASVSWMTFRCLFKTTLWKQHHRKTKSNTTRLKRIVLFVRHL